MEKKSFLHLKNKIEKILNDSYSIDINNCNEVEYQNIVKNLLEIKNSINIFIKVNKEKGKKIKPSIKKAKKLEDLPNDLLEALVKLYELKDGDMFDNCEEIYSYILDDMGHSGNRKKRGDYFIGESDLMIVGEYNVIAQYKQFIKNYDCICDEEFDCILFFKNA